MFRNRTIYHHAGIAYRSKSLTRCNLRPVRHEGLCDCTSTGKFSSFQNCVVRRKKRNLKSCIEALSSFCQAAVNTTYGTMHACGSCIALWHAYYPTRIISCRSKAMFTLSPLPSAAGLCPPELYRCAVLRKQCATADINIE